MQDFLFCFVCLHFYLFIYLAFSGIFMGHIKVETEPNESFHHLKCSLV